MPIVLYTFFLYILQPFIIAKLLWKSYKNPNYRKRIAERYGWNDYKKNDSIWIHAVSLGETIAATELIKQLTNNYPNYTIIITTMTVAGSLQAQKLQQQNVFHCYMPYDLPCSINRFLKKITPKLAIFMETEIWPNTFNILASKNIPILLANARLSERSVKRYQKINKWIAHSLNAITRLAAQDEVIAKRFIKLGINPKYITITGSLKFDIPIFANTISAGLELKKQWLTHKPPNTTIIIAASTHRGEENTLLAVFAQLTQMFTILPVIVPRHPERFNEVYKLCKETGFKPSKRSQNLPVTKETNLILVDTMGELPLILATGDIVFMGGSLVPVGGHNFIEPALIGLPQISGPNIFNFESIAKILLQAQALFIVNSSQELQQAMIKLLKNSKLGKKMGQAGKIVVSQHQGALQKHLNIIHNLMLTN